MRKIVLVFLSASLLSLIACSARARSGAKTSQGTQAPLANENGFSQQQTLPRPPIAIGGGGTVGGRPIMPLGGSMPLTEPLSGVGGNIFATTGATPAITLVNPTKNFNSVEQQNLVSAQYGPYTTEDQRAIIGPGFLPQVDVLSGIATIASGTQGIGQASGVAGYVRNQIAADANGNKTSYAVGLYGSTSCEVSKSLCWGTNTAVQDTGNGVYSAGLTGIVEQNEYDYNVFNEATVVFGSNVIGNFLRQPATAFAYLCQTNSSESLSQSNGPYNHWTACYTTKDGDADDAIDIGLYRANAGAYVASQPIKFAYLNGFGARAGISLSAQPSVTGSFLRIAGGNPYAANYQMDTGGFFAIDNAMPGGAPIYALYSDIDNALHIGKQSTSIVAHSSLVPATFGLQNLGSAAKPFGKIVGVTLQETLSTPASSSAACTAGQFTDDVNYHYVCTATNKWRRVALSDF